MRVLGGIIAAALLLAIGVAVIIGVPARGHDRGQPAMLALHGVLPAAVRDAGPEAVAAYQAAIDHPDVLSSVPCLCGCMQSLNHANNLDCYVESSRDDATVLSSHGLYCVICQRITQDALAGAAAGMTPDELRALIEARYGG